LRPNEVAAVIRIRVEGLRAEDFSELPQNVIRHCTSDLDSGAMVSVNEYQIRVRRLPSGMIAF